MKAGWGTGITILYLGFVVMILGMVYKSCQYDLNLVTDNYYEEDLQYEGKMQVMKKTMDMGMDLDVTIQDGSSQMIIKFPSSKGIVSGNIRLFRHSNRNLDRKYTFSEANNETKIDLQGLEPGLWEVIAEWNAQGEPYISRKSFVYEP